MATADTGLPRVAGVSRQEPPVIGLPARFLLPSFSDLLLVALIAWLFMRGEGWLALLGDGDTGWHIRTGQYILAHAAVPQVDLFSFSKPGQPWFAWEWLTDVLYALLYQASGLKGIVLLSGLVVAASSVLLLRRMLWEGVNAFAALTLTFLATTAAAVHFWARPHIFTFLFLQGALWLLAVDRRRPSRLVWLLIPLTALWVNMHGAWVVLLAMLLAAVVGSAAEEFVSGRRCWRMPGRYALLLAGCGAASLLNPYGLRLHTHAFAYLQADWIRANVREFQSPQFRSESMLQFEILLFCGLLAVPFLVRGRRFVEGLWILAFAHMSLTSARHVPLFALLAAPYIGLELTRAWQWWVARSHPGGLVPVLDGLAADIAAGARRTSVTVLVPLLLLAAAPAPAISWPGNFPEKLFPVRMAEAHADLLPQAKVLTVDQWADYLIYRFYPHQRVFFDGRSDFYGPELGNDYLKLMHAHWDWPRLVDKYGFDLVLAPVDWPLASVLKRAGWPVLGDDGQSILFARPGFDHARTRANGLMKRTLPAEGTGREQAQ